MLYSPRKRAASFELRKRLSFPGDVVLDRAWRDIVPRRREHLAMQPLANVQPERQADLSQSRMVVRDELSRKIW